jgi:hypothetical protein
VCGNYLFGKQRFISNIAEIAGNVIQNYIAHSAIEVNRVCKISGFPVMVVFAKCVCCPQGRGWCGSLLNIIEMVFWILIFL